jgi:hypothetical protein
MKKILTLIIMLMFLLMIVSSANGVYQEKQSIKSTSFGNILYVGGSGPGNYSKIQDAIHDADHGDTVFVYDDSSPYYESNITIEKSITLIGEDRNTTAIDGENNSVIIVIIYTGSVSISGFTIRNCSGSYYTGCITVIMSSYNTISGNIFADNSPDIIIYGDGYNDIVNNVFTGRVVDDVFCIGGGIALVDVSFTNIIRNVFINCMVGITIGSSSGIPPASNSNIIRGNLFDDNDVAMEITSDNTLITRNTISNHKRALNLFMPALKLEGRNNNVSCNNFMNNIRDASDKCYIFSLRDILKIRNYRNVWDGNYWERSQPLPKIIFSKIRFIREYPNPMIFLPFFNIDRHPAQEPYDIGV